MTARHERDRLRLMSAQDMSYPLPVWAKPHKGDKRYVRHKRGKFTKSQDDVGRSLAADRRKRAKRVVKSGEGGRGDQRR
jgi:hypothetical protein